MSCSSPDIDNQHLVAGYESKISQNVTPPHRPVRSFPSLKFIFPNSISLGRIPASMILVSRILDQTTDYRSWTNTGIMASIGASDGVDGKLAKTIEANIKDSVPNRFGKFIDPFTDKFSTDVVLGAIAKRELNDGNRLYGVFVAACAGTIATRDVVTTISRANALRDDKDVSARQSGKIKTLATFITTTAMLSPLAKSTPGRAACCVGLALSTGMSVTSGIELVRSLRDIPQPNPDQQIPETSHPVH
ncbi:CDP-alcohol phosphatidyltransferase family protein [Candidatus Saccharibacteria bacterium]|nr:CDP-alcohol phosphatidyltransferase family protein [Candidatus Saccharibacteria bacterium]